MKTRRPYVPIFMISAHETALSKLALVNVDSLIPKGLGPAYLLEKISQLLRPQSRNVASLKKKGSATWAVNWIRLTRQNYWTRGDGFALEARQQIDRSVW